MRYRRLGRTDLEVSELSYGAARGATEDPKQFIAPVRACIEAGIIKEKTPLEKAQAAFDKLSARDKRKFLERNA